MKAIVLLAGHATRMKPLSDYLNKGMIPVAGRPLAEHVVRRLVHCGFTDLVFAVTRFPEQLEAHFGDGSRFGARVQYVLRPEPSGTAGEVHALREHIPEGESFLVHYGDILHNMDLPAMAAQHRETMAVATVGLVSNVTVHVGAAEMDAEGRLTDFVEKPRFDKPCHAAVNMLGPGIWEHLAPGMDFGYDVFPALVRAGANIRGFLDGHAWWMDVGRLSDLDDANEWMSTHSL
ncbi:MAG: nucleotidyltransferase family protein [Acidobacteriota bacterium]|jgi:mannose-1-phosphate guanylyltransferase/phosphomannomutase|nr:nucleotidyltransferase family protein [Acidobacteriota bacterium]